MISCEQRIFLRRLLSNLGIFLNGCFFDVIDATVLCRKQSLTSTFFLFFKSKPFKWKVLFYSSLLQRTIDDVKIDLWCTWCNEIFVMRYVVSFGGVAIVDELITIDLKNNFLSFYRQVLPFGTLDGLFAMLPKRSLFIPFIVWDQKSSWYQSSRFWNAKSLIEITLVQNCVNKESEWRIKNAVEKSISSFQ